MDKLAKYLEGIKKDKTKISTEADKIINMYNNNDSTFISRAEFDKGCKDIADIFNHKDENIVLPTGMYDIFRTRYKSVVLQFITMKVAAFSASDIDYTDCAKGYLAYSSAYNKKSNKMVSACRLILDGKGTDSEEFAEYVIDVSLNVLFEDVYNSTDLIFKYSVIDTIRVLMLAKELDNVIRCASRIGN